MSGAAYSPILTLVWKEWRSAVDTPLGYVIAVAFLLAAGFFFGNSLFLIGQADMRDFFAILPVLYMFFLPALGMRALSEERRSGTFELLATMPVSTLQIVMGKYLSLLLQMFVLLSLTLLFPVSLSLLAHLDVGQVVASYLAALLLAAAYASVCLFASALSENAVVAYVVGFFVLLAFFLMAQAVPLLPPAAQNWIELISPLQHYRNMLRGVVRADDALFLPAITAIFLGATVYRLESRRWM